MKQVIFIAISILFFSCNKTDEFEFEYCERIEELSAPNGLKLNRVSSIEFNGNFKELQFINDNVGYLLGQNSVGGYADVFKSIDGGKTWTNINLTLRENPINMFFLNEQIGFISYYGENGNLLKTINAGESWEKISYSELNGNLYHIQSDNSNNLYAMLSGLETQKKILKSTNEGVSWEVINQSNEIDFELVTFSFQVHEEALYISGKSGKLIITDLDGNEIKTIETNLSYIWDLDIIDLNNYVITSSEKTIKSTDGGVSWTEIYDKSARIIDFVNEREGLMILNKSYCNTDVYQANDVIAYTNNGGVDWIESLEATNIMQKYKDNQIQRNNSHIVIFGNDLYEIDR